jgi:hypothetical protein
VLASILLHAILNVFLHKLLNVLVQIANEMGFKKKMLPYNNVGQTYKESCQAQYWSERHADAGATHTQFFAPLRTAGMELDPLRTTTTTAQ